jgi:hypothetical protein
LAWIAGRQSQQPEIHFTVVVRHQSTNAAVANASVTLVVAGRPYRATTADDGLATLVTGARAGETGLLTVERAGFARKTERVTLFGRGHEYLALLTPEPATATAAGPSNGADPDLTTVNLTYASAPATPPQGEHWSTWYDVCSEALPQDHVVAFAALYVAGDYACGSWAECQITELGANRACGRFRIRRRSDIASSSASPVHGFLNIGLTPRS